MADIESLQTGNGNFSHPVASELAVHPGIAVRYLPDAAVTAGVDESGIVHNPNVTRLRGVAIAASELDDRRQSLLAVITSGDSIYGVASVGGYTRNKPIENTIKIRWSAEGHVMHLAGSEDDAAGAWSDTMVLIRAGDDTQVPEVCGVAGDGGWGQPVVGLAVDADSPRGMAKRFTVQSLPGEEAVITDLGLPGGTAVLCAEDGTSLPVLDSYPGSLLLSAEAIERSLAITEEIIRTHRARV